MDKKIKTFGVEQKGRLKIVSSDSSVVTEED